MELLVVVGIVGILTAVALPRYEEYKKSVYNAQAKALISQSIKLVRLKKETNNWGGFNSYSIRLSYPSSIFTQVSHPCSASMAEIYDSLDQQRQEGLRFLFWIVPTSGNSSGTSYFVDPTVGVNSAGRTGLGIASAFHCGGSDVVYTYTFDNPEIVESPLSASKRSTFCP